MARSSCGCLTFEEFYTTKPPGKGTGLGLPIARDIISGEFGGTLACTASGPSGTTFAIRLPLPVSAVSPETGTTRDGVLRAVVNA